MGRISDIVSNIGMLATAVIGIFAVLWYPFYHYRESPEQSVVDVMSPILQRIFPFNRGLFEGKVANLWCVAALKPLSIRDHIPEELQPLYALALTLVMMLPFCILLFQIGRRGRKMVVSNSNGGGGEESSRGHIKALLVGAAGTSLSFFLASFQVHEKSILLPLAPLSLMSLGGNSDDFRETILPWFTIVCTWSLWHLLVVDRLQMAYFATMVIYLCYLFYCSSHRNGQGIAKDHSHWVVQKTKQIFMKLVFPGSLLAMAGLHLMEAFIVPPLSLPDIFPVLWIVVGCACFIIIWMASLMDLWILSREVEVRAGNKDKYD